ncbi:MULTISPECIES: TetR/AcrR family transcriptional regulator [Bradyrhizobium]|uniref:Transcriptional regulator, TetR family n=1 Tax=Bradyrhizobium brasilense TaxID=1419277 RepID=A0A1G7IKA2_9BRAD|nr:MULTISPECIES: TetR/AcrR family transcriptional regulator [Bradyrhizobium]MCA6104359.1 TetR/AcrR family transcriptional regulator [Bradyrhizobium australafricanum]MCC8974763.1 TetR/AcrR family transcriptional regulator [Bradyrhizobium brasilense]SDF13035.1 transcriptional regulator, TetR family [Bradyrhizobium brasilense]
MRFEKGHKAATRRHIVDVASKCIRRDGVAAAGIGGIMSEAGLTKGAFSPHFESKEALVREALASALADQQDRLDGDRQRGADLEALIRSYLKRVHLGNPAEGCPSAALLPEIARQPLPTRKAYEKGLRSYVSALAALLPITDAETSRRRATAIFGLMVGTLQFARAVPDAAYAEQILEGGIDAALHLARAPYSED